MAEEPKQQAEIIAPGKGSDKARSGDPTVNIGQLNYQRSDIDAINDLAKTNPKLAAAFIKASDRADERANGSYRFGLAATVLLLIAVLIFVAYLLTYGDLKALIGIGGLLGCALLIRVILTGEWSDTGWFGHLVHTLASVLGSKKTTDRDASEDGPT